jgi:hypothetical protein
MEELIGGARPDYAALANDEARTRRMRTELKLDPDAMAAVDAAYGPLDWRLPETHAIYWACRAQQRAGPESFLPAARMIFQGMAATFMRGSVVSVSDERGIERAPRLDLLDKALAAYGTAYSDHPEESVAAGYVNFLRRAAVLLDDAHRHEAAHELHALLLATFPETDHPRDCEEFLHQTREELLR